MNVKSIVFIFSFFSTICFASNETMRQELDKAWKEEEFADELISRLEKKTGMEMKGYLGVAYVMKSNHLSMPNRKYNYFQKGKKLLEAAIKEMPENIEFIYYRYEIQLRIPKILSYDNLKEDKAKLQSYIAKSSNKSLDENLYKQILKKLQTKN